MSEGPGLFLPEGPLSGLRFSLVGPGRVGSSVARWLLARGATLGAVARRSGTRLPRWAATAGGRSSAVDGLDSTGDDLLLLAVPDPVLPEIVGRLAARPQARVALHVSGRLDAGTLAPLRAGGSAVGSLHPLRAFPRPLPSLAVARRTFLALEGDVAALALAGRVAAALPAPHAEVPSAVRPLYHLAATVAAGGTVTLLAGAMDLHRRAGVPAAAAPGLVELARGALAAVEPAGPLAAVTGPVARGELTYLDQLAAVRETLPALHPLVILIALELLRLLAAEGPLTPSQVSLREALRGLCRESGFLDPLLTWV
jgi:predicted short-subunit dehydrogenase-like oxidoreductase (DUF2520 family)